MEGRALGVNFASEESHWPDLDAMRTPLNRLGEMLDRGANCEDGADDGRKKAYQHAMGFIHGILDSAASRKAGDRPRRARFSGSGGAGQLAAL